MKSGMPDILPNSKRGIPRLISLRLDPAQEPWNAQETDRMLGLLTELLPQSEKIFL
jgi:hypothetical protein